MGKKNFIIILAVLVLAGGALLVSRMGMGSKATGQVKVYLDGTLYATGTLGETNEIVVHGADGAENTVVLTENGAYMAHSTCHNQLCVEQGTVTVDNYRNRAMGTRIICLPNHVEVELVLEQGEADDEVPDV